MTLTKANYQIVFYTKRENYENNKKNNLAVVGNINVSNGSNDGYCNGHGA